MSRPKLSGTERAIGGVIALSSVLWLPFLFQFGGLPAGIGVMLVVITAAGALFGADIRPER